VPGERPVSGDDVLINVFPEKDWELVGVELVKVGLVPHSRKPVVVVSFALIDPLIVAVDVSMDEAIFVNDSGSNLTVPVTEFPTVPVSVTETVTLGIEPAVTEVILRSPINAVALFE
jgi:hypothetical protein